ncbi:group II intron maturase-specific domain-containing protein [Nonomuraea angiospora]|uniref:group II intron maturase-specific domain-containing protein n=1 Tax=Nonomuraea angiospora TaxID=46172 RepID=UPI00344F3893
MTALLADLGLQTRIVHLSEGGEGFDFPCFHRRLVRARGRTGARRVVCLARWPSRKAAQHARDRIRELSGRSRLLVPVETIVQQVNAFLRGWIGYFRYGNSGRVFDKIRTFALARLALFLGKKHKRGGLQVVYTDPTQFGLINLKGAVVAPRPFRSWRATAEHRR